MAIAMVRARPSELPRLLRAIHDSHSPVGFGRLSRQKAHKLRAHGSNSSVGNGSTRIQVWISNRTQVTRRPRITRHQYWLFYCSAIDQLRPLALNRHVSQVGLFTV